MKNSVYLRSISRIALALGLGGSACSPPVPPVEVPDAELRDTVARDAVAMDRVAMDVPDGAEPDVSEDVSCMGGQRVCSGACRDLQNDRAHCGSCDRACAAGELCSAGMCDTTCVVGTTNCANVCRDLSTDRGNCGACDTACPAGQVCSMGACTVSCVAGTQDCGGVCRDLQTDRTNCGMCGRACAAGQVCGAGACVSSCAAGTMDCAGSCRDLQTDRAHCGACGAACVGGQVCVSGACVATCASGTSDCGGVCRDLGTDRSNCGACGNTCAAGQVCAMGVCAVSCGAGTTDCLGICRDTTTDRNHCGACGNACAAGRVCSTSMCVTTCAAGTSECSGSCRDLQTDRVNCGACGAGCAAGQVCSMGVCAVSCGAGTSECSGLCRDTQTDRLNCGACGNVCAAGQVCSAGTCTLTCALGTSNCGGACRDTQTDRLNCGSCGAACPGGQVCSAGSCVATCAAGMMSCGGGCTNVAFDPSNCGACGAVCGPYPNAAPVCVTGACRLACSTGFGDCNASESDGCERDLATDALHCGACGRSCRTEPNASTPCTAGACGALVCDGGFLDCNGDLGRGGDGCEISDTRCPRIAWRTTWGDGNDDTPRVMDVAVGPDGVYVLASYTSDLTVGATTHLAPGEGGVLIALDARGVVRWSRTISAAITGDMNVERLLIDRSSGDLFVVGSGQGDRAMIGMTDLGALNAGCASWVARVASATGDVVWGSTFPNATCSVMTAVALHPSAGLVVGGTYVGAHVMGVRSVATSMSTDSFIATLDLGSGLPTGLFRFGGAAAESLRSLAVLPSGDIVVAGHFSGGIAQLGPLSLPAGALTDAFFGRFTIAGVAVHAGSATSAGNVALQDLAVGSSGDYYVAGVSEGAVTAGALTLNGAARGGILLRIRAATGVAQWLSGSAGGGNAPVGIQRLALDASENVRVAFYGSADATTRFAGRAMAPGPLVGRVAAVLGATGAASSIETFGVANFYANAIALQPTGSALVAGSFADTVRTDGFDFVNAGVGHDQYVMQLTE